MDITPYVGQAFRHFREKAGMSQEQVALAAGLDRTYVSGIERSRRNPSLRSMQKIASVLGADLAELFVKAREMSEIERQGHGSVAFKAKV